MKKAFLDLTKDKKEYTIMIFAKLPNNKIAPMDTGWEKSRASVLKTSKDFISMHEEDYEVIQVYDRTGLGVKAELLQYIKTKKKKQIKEIPVGLRYQNKLKKILGR